jgi:aspartyl-tRNA(Asn)/glutamyl-tRNA(Gln) amidotransferase subunit A
MLTPCLLSLVSHRYCRRLTPSETISHPDVRDMTCATASTRSSASTLLHTHFPDRPATSLHGLRIGLPVQTHLPAPNIQVPDSLLEHLKSLGATLHPVSLPNLHLALPAYYVLASAEASSNLARFGGGWYGSLAEGEKNGAESGLERRRRTRTAGFGEEVRKRILAGAHVLSAEYAHRISTDRFYRPHAD